MLGRELTNFLINHPDDWEDVLAAPPYNLIIRKKDDYVLFKYSQCESDFNEEICQEARGIIFAHRGGTWRIVRLAFDKFFNLGEKFAANINWASFEVSEKIDGSLVTVWYDNGWHVSTNGTIDAYEADVMGRNFGQLFDIAAKNVNLKIEDLSPNYNYTFELVSRYNKIVLNYPTTTLYHLSTRDMLTMDEVFVDIDVQKPKSYQVSTLEELKSIVAAMDESHEGVVVRDAQGRRVKLKTESYFKLHKLANNGNITDKYLVDLILLNDDAEISVYFPEVAARVQELKNIMAEIREEFKLIESAAQTHIKLGTSRKDFAAAVTKMPHLWQIVWFRSFEGRLSNWISDMKPDDWLKFIIDREEKHEEN